jgi:hypothetical protein
VQQIEYAIDIWDLRGLDPRPDAEALHRHLNDFGAEGWELVSLSFNVTLVRHGECHLLVFKRAKAARV